MARVVYASLKSAKVGKKRPSVVKKRLKAPDGTILTVRTIDADSQTFGDDLSYVFKQNVRKARRLNRAMEATVRVPARS